MSNCILKRKNRTTATGPEYDDDDEDEDDEVILSYLISNKERRAPDRF